MKSKSNETRNLRLIFVGVIIFFAAALGFAAISKGAEPFMPGQAQSLQLAEQVWHPHCDHVGVEPMSATTKAQIAQQLGKGGEAFGVTPRTTPCYTEIDWPLIRQYADDELFSYRRAVRIRNEKVYVCAVLVHEMGHIAGFLDPIGAPEWNLQGQPVIDPLTGQQARDHDHSPDHRSIMYPYSNGTYWRCRRLFPMPHDGQGHRPLPDSAPAGRKASL